MAFSLNQAFKAPLDCMFWEEQRQPEKGQRRSLNFFIRLYNSLLMNVAYFLLKATIYGSMGQQ